MLRVRPPAPATVSRIVNGLIVGVPLLLGLLAGIPVFLAILIIELLCYFIFTYDEWHKSKITPGNGWVVSLLALGLLLLAIYGLIVEVRYPLPLP
jgi:hypothetical protein